MESNRVFHRICADEVAELMQNPELQILDTRDRKSFDLGHIGSARNLSGAELDRAILQIPRHKPVLIYCHRGSASLIHAQMFADFGFREVYNLNGGYAGWKLMQSAGQQSDATTSNSSERLRTWLADQGFSSEDIHSTLAGETTPLMRACRLADAAIVAELLVLGAQVDARNSDGNQALWFACFSNSLEIIDLLIATGVDINNQNDNGATCLMYAASSGKDECVAKLLQAGVDTGVKTLDDFTALDMAASLVSLKLLRKAEQRA
ncbi:ankyrin [Sulfuricella sp. T08]|uniref:rhodanese-like domain-containing protein n=1 Tax=Sulfuricella sp. T08 TaxID=1632857 RepID=UPI0006179D32|nr:rhodanese-like domain-containing protein [Sulfuricella sp. T08]GAO35444.1 ankyrin [Sulfuricella sp. T08]